jgi:hypothetical protein
LILNFKITAITKRLAASDSIADHPVIFPRFDPSLYTDKTGLDIFRTEVLRLEPKSRTDKNLQETLLIPVFAALTYCKYFREEGSDSEGCELRTPLHYAFYQTFIAAEKEFLTESEKAFFKPFLSEYFDDTILRRALNEHELLPKKPAKAFIELRQNIADARYTALKALKLGELTGFLCVRLATARQRYGHLARITFKRIETEAKTLELRVYDHATLPDRKAYHVTLPDEKSQKEKNFLLWLRKGISHWNCKARSSELVSKLGASDITSELPSPDYSTLCQNYCLVACRDMQVIDTVRPEVWKLMHARVAQVIMNKYPVPEAPTVDPFCRIRAEIIDKTRLVPLED